MVASSDGANLSIHAQCPLGRIYMRSIRRVKGHSLLRSLVRSYCSLVPHCPPRSLARFAALTNSGTSGERFISMDRTRCFHTVSTKCGMVLSISHLVLRLDVRDRLVIWFVYLVLRLDVRDRLIDILEQLHHMICLPCTPLGYWRQACHMICLPC